MKKILKAFFLFLIGWLGLYHISVWSFTMYGGLLDNRGLSLAILMSAFASGIGVGVCILSDQINGN